LAFIVTLALGEHYGQAILLDAFILLLPQLLNIFAMTQEAGYENPTTDKH
jgi:hypothetical protein